MASHLAPLIIDDRSSGNLTATNGANWRAIADTVMGGVSVAQLQITMIEQRPCLCLTGRVSLENNGGFVQASLDLCKSGTLDATGYAGIEIHVLGNSEGYNLHLRTTDTRIVWQSYRASFVAPPHWTIVRLPFDSFQPHRISTPLDKSQLRRLGLVAIGREMQAEVSIARLSFY